MAGTYSEFIKDLKQTQDWLIEGATNLLPKKKETWIPKNYRPIACLPTTFKILTSVITDRLYSHLEKEAIMTSEQRGGKKDCYGCKDQLMLNNSIIGNYDMPNDHGKIATLKAKQLKLKYKEDLKKMVRDKWKEKVMHGNSPTLWTRIMWM